METFFHLKSKFLSLKATNLAVFFFLVSKLQRNSHGSGIKLACGLMGRKVGLMVFVSVLVSVPSHCFVPPLSTETLSSILSFLEVFAGMVMSFFFLS